MAKKFKIVLVVCLLLTVGVLSYRVSVRYSPVGLRPLNVLGPAARSGIPPDSEYLMNLPASDFMSNSGDASSAASRSMVLEVYGGIWDARIEQTGGIAIQSSNTFRQSLMDNTTIDLVPGLDSVEVDAGFLRVVSRIGASIPMAYQLDKSTKEELQSSIAGSNGFSADLDAASSAIERRKSTRPTYEWVKLLSMSPRVKVFDWSVDEGIGLEYGSVPLRRLLASDRRFFVAEITHDVVSRDGYARSFTHYLAREHGNGSKGHVVLTTLVSVHPIDPQASEFIYGPEQ